MAGVNTFVLAAVLGLASAGGIYGIAQWVGDAPAGGGSDEAPPAQAALLWPFLTGLADETVTTSFVFVAADPAAGEAPLPPGGTWLSDAVGLVDLGVGASCQLEGESCPSVSLAPPGPRFGRDDYNVTAVQFWAFDTLGRLFATNAPTGAADAYELHPSYTPLPRGFWYLGTGEAPDGTTNLPMFKTQARALLDGLPEGAIATTVTDQFRWYMDDSLIMTARIDGLRQAP